MTKNKTTVTNTSVADFINSLTDEVKRADSFRLIGIFTEVTKLDPLMWGTSIIGFGKYHYVYSSGHQGDAPLTGFSPRKDAFAIYFAVEFDKKDELLEKFGKYKAGKGCIYIKKLADVNISVLREIIKNSVSSIRKMYP